MDQSGSQTLGTNNREDKNSLSASDHENFQFNNAVHADVVDVVIFLPPTGCKDQFIFCVSLWFNYYYFSKCFCWVTLLTYMTEQSAIQVCFDLHGTLTSWIFMWQNWVFSQFLSYWTYSFFTASWLCIVSIPLEVVIEYSQNAEEIIVKKISLREDTLYLRDKPINGINENQLPTHNQHIFGNPLHVVVQNKVLP